MLERKNTLLVNWVGGTGDGMHAPTRNLTAYKQTLSAVLISSCDVRKVTYSSRPLSLLYNDRSTSALLLLLLLQCSAVQCNALGRCDLSDAIT